MNDVSPGTQLQVLGDATRLALIQQLRRQPLPVGALADRVPVSRPAVSQHLKVLKAARLVREHRDGTRHYFTLDPDGFAGIRAFLDTLWQDALDAFAAHVEAHHTPRVRKRRKPKGASR
jgi:DNA-binding transcriptional ArsR family regulator